MCLSAPGLIDHSFSREPCTMVTEQVNITLKYSACFCNDSCYKCIQIIARIQDNENIINETKPSVWTNNCWFCNHFRISTLTNWQTMVLFSINLQIMLGTQMNPRVPSYKLLITIYSDNYEQSGVKWLFFSQDYGDHSEQTNHANSLQVCYYYNK